MTSEDMNSEDAVQNVNDEEAFVPVFTSSNHDAEMEANTIQGILDSSDIPTVLVGPHVLPSLDFQVQVPEHLAEQAQEIIEDARAAGPRAAEEGEAEFERMNGSTADML